MATVEELEAFEKTLAENIYFGGKTPSSKDQEIFEKITPYPDPKYENLLGWYLLMNLFTPEIRAKWPAPPQPKAPKKKQPKKETKKEEPKKEEPKKEEAEDDDMDLFGDDDEGDEEAKKLLEAKKAEEAKKKKEEKVAKSMIIFEVKPYDESTDLDQLAAKILAIEMDGLQWKEEYKKEPIAFGVNKLIVGCVIEDDKVGEEDITDQVYKFENEVQSMDVLTFNKL